MPAMASPLTNFMAPRDPKGIRAQVARNYSDVSRATAGEGGSPWSRDPAGESQPRRRLRRLDRGVKMADERRPTTRPPVRLPHLDDGVRRRPSGGWPARASADREHAEGCRPRGHHRGWPRRLRRCQSTADDRLRAGEAAVGMRTLAGDVPPGPRAPARRPAFVEELSSKGREVRGTGGRRTIRAIRRSIFAAGVVPAPVEIEVAVRASFPVLPGWRTGTGDFSAVRSPGRGESSS
jgi:hypothetical protein